LIPSWLRVRIRQIILPPLVLLLLDLLGAAVFFGPAQGFWLFKNTTNWIQMAADLTFTEAVICLLVAGLAGSGIGEHATIVREASTGARVDMNQYVTDREKSIGLAFQLVAIGLILLLLTLLLHSVSS
jgi:hypothetical protein